MCWSQAVLHATDLKQLRPTAYHTASPLQMVRGDPPSIYFPSMEIRVRSVRIDLTTQANFDGASQEIGDLCGIYISVDHKIPGDPDWRFAHGPVP